MEYLTNSLVDYGFQNAEYLAEVANWKENEIDGFLRDLVNVDASTTPRTGLYHLAKLDVCILKRLFKQYFSGDL